jgi:peptidyl-tRNA hydrolase, PTH1 family
VTVSEAWLVAGLGNPGERYAGTRHNAGHMVVDHLARELAGGTAFKAHRGQAVVLETRLPPEGGVPGPRVVLMKPTTYMNLSGGPVTGVARYFGVEPERLVVVHDELDIDLGAIKVKLGGGDGGHNGLRSVTGSLGSPDYVRVRVGIGRPPGRMDPADYVLRPFPASSRTDVEFLVVDGADAVLTVIRDGVAAAQRLYHSRA